MKSNIIKIISNIIRIKSNIILTKSDFIKIFFDFIWWRQENNLTLHQRYYNKEMRNKTIFYTSNNANHLYISVGGDQLRPYNYSFPLIPYLPNSLYTFVFQGYKRLFFLSFSQILFTRDTEKKRIRNQITQNDLHL